MTREQAEKEIRSIERRCRGPQFPTVEPRALKRAAAALQAAFIAADVPADDVAEKIEQLAGRKTGEVIALLLAAGQRDAARALDEATRYRKVKRYDIDEVAGTSGFVSIVPGCGADVNTLILAQELDGEEHAAPCPTCGRTVHWRAPLYESDGPPVEG